MKITVTIGKKTFKSRKEKEAECLKEMQHSPEVVYVEREEIEAQQEHTGFAKEPDVIFHENKTELLTLREAFDRFISNHENTLAKSTLDKYSHLRDRHFESIMDWPVGALTEFDIQSSFESEIEKGWSKRTIQGYKSCLLNVLKEVRPDFHPEIDIDIRCMCDKK